MRQLEDAKKLARNIDKGLKQKKGLLERWENMFMTVWKSTKMLAHTKIFLLTKSYAKYTTYLIEKQISSNLNYQKILAPYNTMLKFC